MWHIVFDSLMRPLLLIPLNFKFNLVVLMVFDSHFSDETIAFNNNSAKFQVKPN